MRYGKFTSSMVEKVLSKAEVSHRPWARLYVYLVDKIRDGSRLDALEYSWLRDFAKEHGNANPDHFLTVQASKSEIARNLFKGHSQSAVRAVQSLQDDGILELVHTGFKGHSSLYVIGRLSDDTVTKTNEIVTESRSERSHKTISIGSKNQGKGSQNLTDRVTEKASEQAIIYDIHNYPDSIQANPGGWGESSKIKCVRCGSSNLEPYPPNPSKMIWCPDCGTAIRVKQ